MTESESASLCSHHLSRVFHIPSLTPLVPYLGVSYLSSLISSLVSIFYFSTLFSALPVSCTSFFYCHVASLVYLISSFAPSVSPLTAHLSHLSRPVPVLSWFVSHRPCIFSRLSSLNRFSHISYIFSKRVSTLLARFLHLFSHLSSCILFASSPRFCGLPRVVGGRPDLSLLPGLLTVPSLLSHRQTDSFSSSYLFTCLSFSPPRYSSTSWP